MINCQIVIYSENSETKVTSFECLIHLNIPAKTLISSSNLTIVSMMTAKYPE